MASSAKEKLVNFLERKAFEPVLKANPNAYPKDKRDMLKDVQDATRSEQERFNDYGSAEEVYQMYKDDLSSEPAQHVHRQLQELDLPTLGDFEVDFDHLAQEVGIRE